MRTERQTGVLRARHDSQTLHTRIHRKCKNTTPSKWGRMQKIIQRAGGRVMVVVVVFLCHQVCKFSHKCHPPLQYRHHGTQHGTRQQAWLIGRRVLINNVITHWVLYYIEPVTGSRIRYMATGNEGVHSTVRAGRRRRWWWWYGKERMVYTMWTHNVFMSVAFIRLPCWNIVGFVPSSSTSSPPHIVRRVSGIILVYVCTGICFRFANAHYLVNPFTRSWLMMMMRTMYESHSERHTKDTK